MNTADHLNLLITTVIIIIFMFLYIIIKKLGWLEEDIEQLKRDQRK
jgi:hypothetical protein